MQDSLRAGRSPRNYESEWFPFPSFFSNDPRRRPYPKEVWSKYPVVYDPVDHPGSHRNKGDSQNCPCSLGETSHFHISYGTSWRVLAYFDMCFGSHNVSMDTLPRRPKSKASPLPGREGHAADPSEKVVEEENLRHRSESLTARISCCVVSLTEESVPGQPLWNGCYISPAIEKT